MKRRFVYFLTGFLAWQGLLHVPAVAGAAEQGKSAVMEEVVVTATRHEEQLTSVPADVTILTEKDIKNSSAINVPELLRSQAGIQVNDISGNQRTYTIDLRGFGESAAMNALVLVDGRRVTQPDLSGTDWALVPLERIERIEIIKGGGGSVLYGDNAAGGVINIITKEGQGFHAGLEAVIASYKTTSERFSVGDSNRLFSYYLSGKYTGRDPYPFAQYDNRTDGYRLNSGMEGKDLGLNLNFYQGDHFKFNLSGGYHWDKAGLPGALKDSDFAAGKQRTDSIFPNDYADTKDYYVKGSPEFTFWGDSALVVDLSYRQRDFLSFSSFTGGNFTGQTKLETVDLAPRIVLKKNAEAFKNSLTVGIDYHDVKEDITNDSLFFGSRTLKDFILKKQGLGYYLHNELTVVKNIVLSAGYRRDHAKFIFEPGVPDSNTVDQDAYTAGLNYIYSGKSYLYASYARGFRYPVLDEFFSFFTNTVATTLMPQESDDYIFGIRHYVSDAVYANINVSRLDAKKEIFFNPATFSNENLDGRTRRQGIELSFHAAVAAWLSLQGSFTYLQASIEDGQFAGKDVPGVAQRKATLGASFYPVKSLALALNGIYVGSRPFISDFANTFSNQEEYYLVNFRGEYRWRYLKGFLSINNLFDKEYNEFVVLGGIPIEKGFYPSPKRNFLVGLAFDY